MKYSMRSNVLFDEKNNRLAYIHASGKPVLGLGYSPLMKTWSVNGKSCFSPLLICGIICFCKYLEFENEAVFL